MPCLGWAPCEYKQDRRPSGRAITRILSEQEDATVKAVNESIVNDLTAIDVAYPEQKSDIAIVLGHGVETTAQPFVEVLLPEPMSMKDWSNLADHRVIVVHACNSGRTVPSYLGDFGSLPRLALNMGCRLFCAPVAEPREEAAIVLNRHLFQTNGTSFTFADRYLDAIYEHPAVSVYNIYGVPLEPVIVDAGAQYY